MTVLLEGTEIYQHTENVFSFYANNVSCFCILGNGGLSAWTDSTVCSKTCAGGQKNQVRTCTNPTPDPAGGVGCDPQDTGRTMACNTQACPVG